MIHLSIEASTGVLGLCLLEDSSVLGVTSLSAPGAASEILPQSVGLLLESARKTADTIQMVSVSMGPGSYSSLRVAHSFGSGMALALSIPLVLVSPFETLALQWEHLPGKKILFVVDARQSQVVGECRVRESATGSLLRDVLSCLPEEPVAIGTLLDRVDDCIVAGPGIRHLPGDCVSLWPSLTFFPGLGVAPDPACQGRVALKGGEAGTLVYGRPAVES